MDLLMLSRFRLILVPPKTLKFVPVEFGIGFFRHAEVIRRITIAVFVFPTLSQLVEFSLAVLVLLQMTIVTPPIIVRRRCVAFRIDLISQKTLKFLRHLLDLSLEFIANVLFLTVVCLETKRIDQAYRVALNIRIEVWPRRQADRIGLGIFSALRRDRRTRCAPTLMR